MTSRAVQFFSEPMVKLVEWSGSDSFICDAARVSTNRAEQEYDAVKDAGLINYLMSHRHGSPFEHGSMTFLIEAPIFVFREFHRHRAGWSYNEMSGRYTQLEPHFYLPNENRATINVGTSARPEMVAAPIDTRKAMEDAIADSYRMSWDSYLYMLEIGIAKEVARVVLPVGITSKMYATCNPRSLMHFLSLRTHDKAATQVSYPQFEIEQVARAMEEIFKEHFPFTYSAWVKNGRVAP